ncbi:unnamed protein product [Brassica napus]|uniref:Kinesin-like protein n=1 Tax=Brassica napus TaxID=3708 RepID=A0A816Q4V7_BRANA|nr:unnamed protein product [Brassica napus]
MPPSDGFYSPELRGDFGAGLLDLHAMDDTELLSEVFTNSLISEPFEPSPFMPSVNQAFEEDFSVPANQQQRQEQDAEPSSPFPRSEKESSGRENSVAKIRVVVRKRPLNKKETAKKEDDIITVSNNSLTVHEIKLKVDLTAYMEKHEFCFDAVLGEHVSNDEVYRVTIEPIIPTIFQRTKATCFAYGQTGSGKTFTMKPLPIRARSRSYEDVESTKMHVNSWLTNKLLLSRKLCMREDGRQQVCIVGLQEFEVSDIQIVKDYIDKGSASRSTGSTGANEESSRSHAILQLVVKKHVEVKETRRNNNDNNESRGKVVGKISFIDLAGSERGADTTDNDRQTRIEGAEINKSLLALKECIRALDNDQLHIPFRGSKLTEVLRDSFVGNSRTVMISCISPNEGSCEHTLNTLRYADRVTSLSKSGNSKKDQTYNSLPPANKDASLASSQLASNDAEDEEKVKKVSPTRRKVPREEKPERYLNLSKRDSISASDVPATINFRQLNSTTASRNTNDGSSRQYETITEPPSPDENISALLEEEEALITAHRKEIEDTMEIVREEMKLLAEVDRPGSMIDNYVTQLNFALSRKAAGLVSLQARLARFQHRLKEQEILSRKRVPR